MDEYESLLESTAGIDTVTSFGDREALFEEVANALEPGSPLRVLVVYDLAGLDEYRTLHGLIAADQLVVRLARRLAGEVGKRGQCFRSRADEFWALVDGSLDEARPILDGAARALREEGHSGGVTAAFGIAFLPDEADEPMEALMIADRELGAARRARERRATPRPGSER